MNQIYRVLIKLLIEKSNISIGEVRNLKYSTKYILQKNKNLKLDKSEKSQFIQDCEILLEAIESLENKIRVNICDMKKKVKEFDSFNNVSNCNHLTDMLLLDCFQEREYSLSEKLEYLYHSYENLISPYQTLYLPLPTSYRRVRTSNLMLYFNKTLNQKLKILSENFFKINNKDFKAFSTWNFSDYDHVKNIDNSNSIFLSLSFWFYEKQLFYPVAFHEIAHSLYYESDKTIRLDEKDRNYIKSFIDSETKDNEYKYKRNQILIQSIYQDIIADFSAYSLSGDSYIFTLFFHGFLQGLYKNFYKDLEIKNLGKEIKDEDRRCKNREKDLTLLDWSFQERGQNFLSYFIRLKLLIKLSKRIKKYHKLYKDDIFKDEIKQIEEILGYIYPDLNSKNNKNSFEDILNSFHKENRQYKYWKNYTLMLVNIFENIVFDGKKIDARVAQTLYNIKLDFQENTIFEEILKDNKESIIENLDIKKLVSSFDLYWKLTFQEKKYLGRLLRLKNLSELKVKPSNTRLDDMIYELVFYKFASHNNPYLMFNRRGVGKNIINDRQLKYAFGPYDFVELNKKTTLDKDDELKKDSKDNFFFTERHALLLLNEIKRDKNRNIFDICISIDIENELEDEVTKEFYSSFEDYFKYLKSEGADIDFEKISLFASLGNENFLLYVKNTKIEDFEKIISYISNKDKIQHIKNIHTTLLVNNNYNINNLYNDLLISEKSEVVILGKLKLDSYYEEVKKKIDSKEYLKLYRKYGVFDFMIRFVPIKNSNDTCEPKEGVLHLAYETIAEIDELISDIQLEYQSSN